MLLHTIKTQVRISPAVCRPFIFQAVAKFLKEPPLPPQHCCLRELAVPLIRFLSEATWFQLSLGLPWRPVAFSIALGTISYTAIGDNGFYFSVVWHFCYAKSRIPIAPWLFYFYKPPTGFAPRLEYTSIPTRWYFAQEHNSLLPQQANFSFRLLWQGQ